MYVIGSITIFFENPFWVGILERKYENQYEVARYVFGAEPSNAEILDLLKNHYDRFEFCRRIQDDENIEIIEKSFKKKLHKAKKEQLQGCNNKSLKIFQAEFERIAIGNKKELSLKRKEKSKESFTLKQERKKLKKRGH